MAINLPSKRQEITIVGEDVKEREPSCTVGGNANLCSHYWKQYGGSSKKLKIELLYDTAIPLLDIHQKKLKSLKSLNLKDTCTPMFIVALFKIAKMWEGIKMVEE